MTTNLFFKYPTRYIAGTERISESKNGINGNKIAISGKIAKNPAPCPVKIPYSMKTGTPITNENKNSLM